MTKPHLAQILTDTAAGLASEESLSGVLSGSMGSCALPSGKVLEEVVTLCRALLLPGFYQHPAMLLGPAEERMRAGLNKLHALISSQALAALCFEDERKHCESCREANEKKANDAATTLISKFPEIRQTLKTDIQAAYNGDPAATSYAEVIACYPSIRALTNYRVAHELWLLGVPLVPRMMTELAHSETGIDIHPRAVIGHSFTIDHGTGVVIGATCHIGNNVKLYQGVTLGAKSFPLDPDGNPIKGIPRHPIIDDDVIIYANATLLGRIHVGKGCVIGANVWVTEDMDPYTTKVRK